MNEIFFFKYSPNFRLVGLDFMRIYLLQLKIHFPFDKVQTTNLNLNSFCKGSVPTGGDGQPRLLADCRALSSVFRLHRVSGSLKEVGLNGGALRWPPVLAASLRIRPQV